MRRLLTGAAIVVGALYFGALEPADAALVSLSDTNGCNGACEGITYTLEAQATANPLTEQFALLITGENANVGMPGGDTIGGRTGINAIAFNLVSTKPPSPNAGTMVGTLINGVLTAPDPRFVFQTGGLNSSGCNGNGSFFCFDNTTIPPTPASPLITGPVVLGFEVTLSPGDSWSNYTTALKIDWVGPSQNNYSLVSEDIPVNTTCPDCVINPVITPVPEPATLALLGVGLLGLAAVRYSRRA